MITLDEIDRLNEEYFKEVARKNFFRLLNMSSSPESE